MVNVTGDRPYAPSDLGMDPLTGLYTRAAANRIVLEGVRRAQENDTVISVALLDVDRFQAFDEEYGLMAGDALLKRVAGGSICR